jgi:hypothetical protein
MLKKHVAVGFEENLNTGVIKSHKPKVYFLMEDQKLGQKPMGKEVIEHKNDSLDKMTTMIERNRKKNFKLEKQLLISLINDYSLFGTHDNEVIQMLSEKIGKKIS